MCSDNTHLLEKSQNRALTFWLVNAGRHGEQEKEIVDENITAIGWEELPDLSQIGEKDELKELYIKIYTDEKMRAVANRVGQVWRFIKEIKKGDLIATPLKSQSLVMIGEVTGNYTYKKESSNAKHRRTIVWKKTFPRSAFDQDILYSLGAFLTVGQVRSDDAETRVRKMLDEKHMHEKNDSTEDLEDKSIGHDLEQAAIDRIVEILKRNFKGHDLAMLINKILIAKGYTTRFSTPGPDGGLDILVGSGNMGFDNPKIGIQVKSSESTTNVGAIRQFNGVLGDFGADYGIFVAWGGLTKDAEQEINKSFFTRRWWDQGKIVKELLENYDKLDDELKSEIPLRKIWTVVEE